MMTPQEVANCTFAKSMVGGYNMTSVDDFLDKLTEDYSALYKENAALKSKLKTVTEKLAEYRDMEGAMSSTLLTAQKMASSMLAEAEQKKKSILADATASAQARQNQADQAVAAQEQRLTDVRERVDRELEAERKRLALGQEKLRAFIKDVTGICNDQLALLELLPELPMEEPPVLPASIPVPTPTVVMAPPPPPEQEVQESLQPEDAPEAVAAFSPAPEAGSGSAQGDPFDSESAASEPEDLEETRVLDDLQFGRNYKRD